MPNLNLFTMSPPNDEAEELHAVRVENMYKLPTSVSVDPYWKPSASGSTIPPEWFNPVRLETYLKFDKDICCALEELWNNNWDYTLRKKYRGLLQRKLQEFLTTSHLEACDDFATFWAANPEYRGKYRYEGFSFSLREIEWEEDGYALPILTAEQQEAIKKQRAKDASLIPHVLTVIADWCMQNFCHNRDDWMYVNVIPVDIGSLEPAEPTKLTASKLAVAKRKMVVVDGPPESEASKKNKKAIAALRRQKGKLDQDIEDMLNS